MTTDIKDAFKCLKYLLSLILALALALSISVSAKAAIYDFVPENPEDSTLVCFVSTACPSCHRVLEHFETFKEEYELEDGSITRLYLHVININEGDGSVIAQEFFDAYKVPQLDRRTPILFYAKGYMSGDVAINQNLPRLIESGQAKGFAGMAAVTSSNSTGIPFLAGIVGGLNPCSISLALLLLTLVSNRREKILKVGFAYIASKVLTYFAVGIFLYSFVQALDSDAFRLVANAAKWFAAILAMGLCIFNLMDFLNARKQNYGKIKLQLPKKLRSFSNNLIKTAASRDTLLIAGVFLIGAIVSAGEFLCTGQVYLATILYIIKSTPESFDAFFSFLAYVAGMALPMILIVIFCSLGKRVLELSELARKNLPFIKLANALLFLLFAAYMILSK
jgi:cytochrome c biogenesis protein CcdA